MKQMTQKEKAAVVEDIHAWIMPAKVERLKIGMTDCERKTRNAVLTPDQIERAEYLDGKIEAAYQISLMVWPADERERKMIR